MTRKQLETMFPVGTKCLYYDQGIAVVEGYLKCKDKYNLLLHEERNGKIVRFMVGSEKSCRPI